MTGRRRGFTLLEIQAAFVILGFSVAALVPFAVGQLKLVAALERRLPPNATYVLVSDDHEMVTLLAAGSGTSTPSGAGTTTNNLTPGSTSRAVAITQVQPFSGGGSMDLVATVTVKKP
jgi:type II secretory pathway pseudopilin PulG